MRPIPRRLSFSLLALAALLGLVRSTPAADPAPALPPATAPATRGSVPAVQRLLYALGDPDPAVRDEASGRLLAMGQAVRPALARARASNDPEIRVRATDLLQRLPWFLDTDPPEAKRLLADYGQRDPAARRNVIFQLNTTGGRAVLPRLLLDEPSAEVRWTIASTLRYPLAGDAVLNLRQLAAARDNAPALAIAGWANRRSDPAKAADLLARAADLLPLQPPGEPYDAHFAFEAWSESLVALERYPAAADATRRWLAHARLGRPDQWKVVLYTLFALHADHGPLPGFADDLAANADRAFDAPVLYATGRLLARNGAPQAGRAYYALALTLRPGTPDDYLSVADFLVDRGWFDVAEPELKAVLRCDGENKEIYHCNAHLRYARLCANREDDFNTAEHLRTAMELRVQAGGALIGRAEDNIWTEVHWRYFRHARTTKNAAKMNDHLDKLLALNPTDVGLAEDVIPTLKELNRDADARRLFASAYARLRQTLDAAGADNAEAKNNLAWLCARSDEKLDEALRLATAAVAARPDHAPYLDTLAEVHFRLGNHAQAVRIESRALEFAPDNQFMKDQLERFRRGKEEEKRR